ncbi:MAG: hypothetical protein AUG91_08685 [Actinobacteria bacterium 13_1_20CM_4_69_9]|nr:MAG: hypothetical protein AUG91_08685 [Actinobacteria bacterium 13_1_20CM_4_69_9]
MTATGSATGTSSTGASATGNTQTGSVLGATSSAGKGHGQGPQGGVLGAIQAVGQGSLPFTGFPLWIAVAAALAVIALGVGMRRQARVTA